MASLINIDYAEIEKRMSKELQIDIHTQLAAELFMVPPEHVTNKQRNHAKALNYLIR